MTNETTSNVNNRYIICKESSYGTFPNTPTLLDFGYVQTISLNEEENVERNDAINTGHTPASLENGIYSVSGSITTRPTHSSIQNLLEALCGDIEIDGLTGKYSIITAPVVSDDLSYALKYTSQTGKIKIVTGISFTGGEISVNRDGMVEFTLNYTAQLVENDTETLSPETTIGKPYWGLDCYVKIDGEKLILDDFSISLDWGVDDADSRGIEDAGVGKRRAILRVVRNNLTLNGSFTAHLNSTLDTGYLDEPIDRTIELIMSRGTTNEHVFTIETSRINSRGDELTTDNGVRKQTIDYEGIDLSVSGDAFEEESP